MNSEVRVETTGKGLYDITHKVRSVVGQSEANEALVTIFLRHTSASLVIQENADPSVQRDLDAFFERLVPEDLLDASGQSFYSHDEEGPDDMPAHIKTALTQTHLSIPLVAGELALGTWQAIYLWEHRSAPHTRKLVISLSAVL